MKSLTFFIVFCFLFAITQSKPTTGDYIGIYLPVFYKKSLQDQAANNLDSELVRQKTHLIYGLGIIQSIFVELGYQHNYVKDNESAYNRYLNLFEVSLKYFHSELEKYDTYGLGINFAMMKTNNIKEQVKDAGYVMGVEANYSFLISSSQSEDHYVQLRLIYPILNFNRNEYTNSYKAQNIRIAAVYRYHF